MYVLDLANIFFFNIAQSCSYKCAQCRNMFVPRSDSPAFLQTTGAELPWDDEPIFTRVLMHETDKSLFHKVDLFHTVTLGVGKSFASSSLAILQECLPGSSIEERLRQLSSLYLEFCKESQLNLICCY